MRDKLVELIKNGGVIIPETAEAVADHLIANNVFVLPEQMKGSWELTSAFVLRLFCANEEEVAKIKQEFELQKAKQILTDIRDYLKNKKELTKNIFSENDNDCADFAIRRFLSMQSVEIFVDGAISDLTEYAEKLGVEL